MDEQGDVATVIDDEFGAFSAGVRDGLLGAPPVFFQGFAFPREDGDTGGCDGCGCVVLGGEDVATGPAHGCSEVHEGLDEHSGLDGHVQGTRDAHSGEGFRGSVFFADGHEARHFLFGDGDFFTAPIGEGEVADFEVCCYGSLGEHDVVGVVLVVVGRGLADERAECFGFVGDFPGDVWVLFAEVPVVGRFGVNGAQQVELFDDAGGLKGENFQNGFLDFLFVEGIRAERVDVHRDRVGMTDCVSELDFATFSEAGSDHIFCDVASHVGRRAVHFGGVFS